MIFDVIFIRIIWTVYEPFHFVEFYISKKLSAEGKSRLKILAGISSWTYNSIPPPFLLRANLKGVWNLSIKNWPCGKLLLPKILLPFLLRWIFLILKCSSFKLLDIKLILFCRQKFFDRELASARIFSKFFLTFRKRIFEKARTVLGMSC